MHENITLKDFVKKIYEENEDAVNLVIGKNFLKVYLAGTSPSFRNFVILAKVGGYEIACLDYLIKTYKADTKVEKIRGIQVRKLEDIYTITDNNDLQALVDEYMSDGGKRSRTEIKEFLFKKHKIKVAQKTLTSYLEDYGVTTNKKSTVLFFKKAKKQSITF